MNKYNLSTDYHLLWKLAMEHELQIAGWIYEKSEIPDRELKRIIQIKKSKIDNDISIGSLGNAYAGYQEGIEGFLKVCKYYKLEFILPEVEGIYSDNLLEYLDGCYYCNEDQQILSKEGQQTYLIANIRGYGKIVSMLENADIADIFQDKVGEFIASAIAEKVNREK